MRPVQGRNVRGSLKRANLKSCRVFKADFSAANLRQARLGLMSSADPDLPEDERDYEVDFSGAVLEGADLRDSNLPGSNFRQANFRNADMREANVDNACFDGAVLTGAQFVTEGAWTPDADFSEAIDVPEGLLEGAEASAAAGP